MGPLSNIVYHCSELRNLQYKMSISTQGAPCLRNWILRSMLGSKELFANTCYPLQNVWFSFMVSVLFVVVLALPLRVLVICRNLVAIWHSSIHSYDDWFGYCVPNFLNIISLEPPWYFSSDFVDWPRWLDGKGKWARRCNPARRPCEGILPFTAFLASSQSWQHKEDHWQTNFNANGLSLDLLQIRGVCIAGILLALSDRGFPIHVGPTSCLGYTPLMIFGCQIKYICSAWKLNTMSRT